MVDLKVLEKINEAPQQGYYLAYTREKVLLEEYTSLETVKEKIKDWNLLELHLFDENKEYRCILTESKRHAGKTYIDQIVDFDEKETAGQVPAVYAEEVYLEHSYCRNGIKKITVLNHICYDKKGMAVIDNYRLKMGGMKS